MEQPNYSFSSKPRAVQTSRKAKGIYRPSNDVGDDEIDNDSARRNQQPVNIMHDRRVFRGSTYSSHNTSKIENLEKIKREKELRRKRLLEKKKQSEQSQYGSREEVPAAPNHQHQDVQTEKYLEELTDKVPEVSEETQTEQFMDRPPEPLFMPMKTGVDRGTQVDSEELFDFDLEVEPILEVLVGKTLEHAMMEVMEEEELAAIRNHQEKFENERNVELAEVQRLEAESKRIFEEKQRRIEQQEAALKREVEICEKVAARAFASDYLQDLHTSVFDKLMDNGTFYDPVEKEVEDEFLPWLMNQVQSETATRNQARILTDLLIENALNLAPINYNNRLIRIQEDKKRIEEEQEQEKQRLAKEQADAEAQDETLDENQLDNTS